MRQLIKFLICTKWNAMSTSSMSVPLRLSANSDYSLSLPLPLPVTLNQQVVHRLPPHLSAGPFHSIPLGSVTACRSPAIVNVIYGHHHRIIHFPFASLWTGSSSTSTSGRMSLAEDQLICHPHHQTASQPSRCLVKHIQS